MAGKGGANPGAGRPKGAANKITAEIKAVAQKHGPAAIAELARIAAKSESDAARVAACREILDRAYGKSPQAITGEDGGAVAVRTEYSDYDIARRIAHVLYRGAEMTDGDTLHH